MSELTAFYVPTDDGGFESTPATTSPWDVGQQHGGPPSALLARAIQRCEPRADMAVSRVTVDFLGGIPQGVMNVTAEVIRPGRRIELVEAHLEVAGRRVAVARAWRSHVQADVAADVPPRADEPAPLPEAQPQRYFNGVAEDWGYGRAIEWRFVSGGYNDAGPAAVWARPRIPLVAGEPTTGLQRALVIADSANGISAVLEMSEWLFIPPGLSLTVYRESDSEWVLLDARTAVAARGSGMTHAVLSDPFGEFGVATQPLLVQRR